MISKIKLLFDVFLLYSNPFTVIASKLGWINGIKEFRMRTGEKFFIRADTTDVSVINEIYIKKIYDEAILKRPICPTVIDIGANIGAFSLRAVRLCHKPKIYAFEPYSKNFDLLRKNIYSNKLEDTIFPIKKAVNKDGKTKYLNIQVQREGASSLYSDPTSITKIKEKIETIKLSDFLDREHIAFVDLLKLDCEGAEFEILYSLDKKHIRMMKRIVLEYHEYFGTGKVAELKKFLEKEGFKVKLNYIGLLGMMFAER